jgi:hypothetical protein
MPPHLKGKSMSVLDKIDFEIDRLESEIKDWKRLRELAVSAQEKPLETPQLPLSEPQRTDCQGLTIMECCQKILSEREEAHYSEIAREALQRGWDNKRGSAPEAVERSFFDALRRSESEFKRLGHGYYQINDDGIHELADRLQNDTASS